LEQLNAEVDEQANVATRQLLYESSCALLDLMPGFRELETGACVAG
jgi:hypothetical protein